MTDEDGGGVEEWDADFLDQLIELEERAISSSGNPTEQQQTLLTSLLPQQPQPSYVSNAGSTSYYSHCKPSQHQMNSTASYSPPRQLSQRPSSTLFDQPPQAIDKCSTKAASRLPGSSRGGGIASNDAKEEEIQRLKRELERVSNQLTELEQECSTLRKERGTKPRNEDRDAVADHHKSGSCSREDATSVLNTRAASRNLETAKTSEHQAQPQIDIVTSNHKAIGVQTSSVSESTKIAISDAQLNCLGVSEKLRNIWSTPSSQKLGRNVVSGLLMACAADFQVLFGCMNMNVSSKVLLDSLAGERSSNLGWQLHARSFHTLEAVKVSHLYHVLTEIGNGMLQVEMLIEPLLDLCSLGNVVIIHKTLHVLHMFLKHLLTLERKSCRRDNVMMEGGCLRSDDGELNGNENMKIEDLFCANKSLEMSHASHLPLEVVSDAENKTTCSMLHPMVMLSCIDWVSLFNLMCQISVRNTEKHVKFEAVSIMNIIVLRSDAHLERDRFGQTLGFESIAQLLKLDVGLDVRKKALHLLHLLLNSLKVLATFCSGCNKANGTGATNDDEPTSKSFTIILEGLAECLACHQNAVQGLELQRNAIVMLAFLASSGKSGFDILVSHKLPREANFLMLILQVIVSEIDTDASASTESTEILKARTLLVREALILLNRLVSNPSYSGTVLRVLTASIDVASLTFHIANGLTWKDQGLKQSDSLAMHMRETDIFDLARVFKKRVFAYFGDTVS